MMHSHKDALTETIMEPVVLILVVMDDALAHGEMNGDWQETITS